MTITIPAYIARTQLGSLLKQVSQRKARFIITKSGKPTAVLMGATDFDDILEELDPEFQKSLKAAAKEIRAGKGITLQVGGPVELRLRQRNAVYGDEALPVGEGRITGASTSLESEAFSASVSCEEKR